MTALPYPARFSRTQENSTLVNSMILIPHDLFFSLSAFVASITLVGIILEMKKAMYKAEIKAKPAVIPKSHPNPQILRT